MALKDRMLQEQDSNQIHQNLSGFQMGRSSATYLNEVSYTLFSHSSSPASNIDSICSVGQGEIDHTQKSKLHCFI